MERPLSWHCIDIFPVREERTQNNLVVVFPEFKILLVPVKASTHSGLSPPLKCLNGPLKADSHIACRAHVAPMPFPCHAVLLRV